MKKTPTLIHRSVPAFGKRHVSRLSECLRLHSACYRMQNSKGGKGRYTCQDTRGTACGVMVN